MRFIDMKESFLTVVGEYSETTIIEKSKFICYLKHVENEPDAREFINAIKKRHFDATHNCSAFIADGDGNLQRFSDDGEPQGTAGMPMLEALKGKGVFETVAVVTRYFGGIKLGAGGLVRAYGGCVSSALNNAEVAEKCLCAVYKINSDYDKYRLVLKLFESIVGASVLGQDFSDGVSVIGAVKVAQIETFLKKLTELFCGKEDVLELYRDYLIIKG